MPGAAVRRGGSLRSPPPPFAPAQRPDGRVGSRSRSIAAASSPSPRSSAPVGGSGSTRFAGEALWYESPGRRIALSRGRALALPRVVQGGTIDTMERLPYLGAGIGLRR